MLESSTSVSEVEDRLRRFLPAVGLDGCALEATLSSLTVSHSNPGRLTPITTMRDINVGFPRLERLSGTVSLLDQLERGELELREAFKRLHTLEHAPARPLRYVRAGILLSVIGWVIFLNGLDVVTVLAALLATLVTFPVERVVGDLRLPLVSDTFLAAIVIAAIPDLVAAAGVWLKVGPPVVGALTIYLPGRAFVSSVIDGPANEPLSAMSRELQALVGAGSLTIGMLVGTRIERGSDCTTSPT